MYFQLVRKNTRIPFSLYCTLCLLRPHFVITQASTPPPPQNFNKLKQEENLSNYILSSQLSECRSNAENRFYFPRRIFSIYVCIFYLSYVCVF